METLYLIVFPLEMTPARSETKKRNPPSSAFFFSKQIFPQISKEQKNVLSLESKSLPHRAPLVPNLINMSIIVDKK